MVINYRVNAGFIARDHWTQDEKMGGGRIVGEVCHFVDLMQFFTDASPEYVFADCLQGDNSKAVNEDNLSVIIRFSNGSIGNLVYVANGDKGLAKERIELSCAGKSAVIDDFKKLTMYSNNKTTASTFTGKGHKQEVEAFIDAIKTGKQSPIEFDSMYLTTLTTFKILDSLKTGLPQMIEKS